MAHLSLPALDSGRFSARWRRGALIVLLVVGVLSMHALIGSGVAGAQMAHPRTAHEMAEAVVGEVAPLLPGEPGGASHSGSHAGATAACLALLAGFALLLGASRAGRPVSTARRDPVAEALRRLMRRARPPDQPDLHRLSVLRC